MKEGKVVKPMKTYLQATGLYTFPPLTKFYFDFGCQTKRSINDLAFILYEQGEGHNKTTIRGSTTAC